jgi:aspartyl-tRNA synthetase
VHEYRTHTCGELRRDHVGAEARLSGWVRTVRDHGGLTFFDLRDQHGVTQVVIPADAEPEVKEAAGTLGRETVVTVTGVVRERPPDTVNPQLATGEVELFATDVTVQGAVRETLPFDTRNEQNVGEDTRLRYRFLDLRSERMQRNVRLRSEIIASIRRRMTSHGFLEIQTPILTSSSPEGARDYLVPSRRYPGKFYALPQAPQQFKQLLMVGGFDRYFQIAPCFRDEDGRADRSPGEFYQLDLEMAFATQEDVFAVVEDVLAGLFAEMSDWAVTPTPFPRLTYRDALDRYGSDKPDLRNPLVVADVSAVFRESGFRVFAGKTVKAIRIPGGGAQGRSFFDRATDFATSVGASGLAWLKVDAESAFSGPIVKFLSEGELADLGKAADLEAGDAVVFLAGDPKPTIALAGRVRAWLGETLDLIETGEYRFCWIVDYPMYERDENGRVDFSHNPFSMPQGGADALRTLDPEDVLAYQYDLVCNGYELSSGAVRNHDPDLMVQAFGIAGYSAEEVAERFPALLNAFKYGAPPHAGFAPGIDRIVMLLTGETLIRDVIAFPMTVTGLDLLMNAPSEVTPEQLRELHIRTVKP